MFEKTSVYDYAGNPFEELAKNWVLISAKANDKVNTMTASWGSLGVIWGKETITVYIRQSRYTKEFVDAQDYFTVSLFDGQKKALGLLGSKSGRDGDKITEAGLHVTEVDGQPTFEESKAVFVCKKVYQTDLQIEDLSEEAKSHYTDNDFHTLYMGEIVGFYVNNKLK